MKKFTVFINMCAIIILISQSAYAVGIGVYGTGGISSSKYKNNHGLSSSTCDYFYGGGLILDTNVAKNETLGYRFTAGYEQFGMMKISNSEPDTVWMMNENTNDSRSGTSFTMINRVPIHRASMSHTLTMCMIKNEHVHFWGGPRLGLHYLRLRNSYTSMEGFSDMGFYALMRYPVRVNNNMDIIGFDALLALGLNINIKDVATLFWDLGLGYMGKYNLNYKANNHGFGMDMKIGLMFRINDTYKPASTSGDIK